MTYVPVVGWCEECGKKTYWSRKEARRIARLHHSSHKSAYPCPINEDWWHVGELSWLVIKGVYAREDLTSYAQIRRNLAA